MNRELYKSRLWKSILVSILILVSADLSLLIIESNRSMPEPYDWGNRGDIPYKINMCKELFRENPDKLKIIVVGDSRGQQSFWSTRFDNYFQNETITYNLCFAGTGALFQAFLINSIFIPQLHPDFVFWDLSFNDFGDSDAQNIQNHELFSLPGARYYSGYSVNSTIKDNFKLWLMQNSRLYRYRYNLFPSIFQVESTKGEIIAKYQDTFSNGFWETTDIYSSNDTEMSNFTYSTPLNWDTIDEFISTTENLEENSIGYLVIHPPHNHAHWINQDLQIIFESLGASHFLDLNGNTSLMDDALYFGKDHLNREGAKLYTEFVYNKTKTEILKMLSVDEGADI